MSKRVATIDFHVTSECDQSCPYCWGPRDFDEPVDTQTALRIIDRVKTEEVARIVFTGGDPLKRDDTGELIRHAKTVGLEVALSTTGDALDEAFLASYGGYVDLVSLPLDGPTEAINARTKEPGHFAAIMSALEMLRGYQAIDVKLCTPVTRHNLESVPDIVRLAEDYADTTDAKVFYNIFQAFPRAMADVDWDALLVTGDQFAELERSIRAERTIRVNFLSHETLDRLYVMIFPDGSLVVPSGADFFTLGPFLEIDNLDEALERSRFDSARHLLHSKGWSRVG